MGLQEEIEQETRTLLFRSGVVNYVEPISSKFAIGIISKITEAVEGVKLPIIKIEPTLDIGAGEYGVQITTVEKQAEIDAVILTEDEWKQVEGDDEDIMITQHNKSLEIARKAILKALESQQLTQQIKWAVKE